MFVVVACWIMCRLVAVAAHRTFRYPCPGRRRMRCTRALRIAELVIVQQQYQNCNANVNVEFTALMLMRYDDSVGGSSKNSNNSSCSGSVNNKRVNPSELRLCIIVSSSPSSFTKTTIAAASHWPLQWAVSALLWHSYLCSCSWSCSYS